MDSQRAQAEAAFITAQREAETSVATAMATSLDLAWATFQQHYSQAKQTWWQDHQADYLASVTSANQVAVNTAKPPRPKPAGKPWPRPITNLRSIRTTTGQASPSGRGHGIVTGAPHDWPTASSV